MITSKRLVVDIGFLKFRRFHRASCLMKMPKRVKVKSQSSKEWLSRQMSDPYVKIAKLEQYRARSAFKLIEIEEKYKILRPGDVVIDCGAAPGSWTQVAVERVNANGKDDDLPRGQVIAVDLLHIEPLDGAVSFDHSDFTSEKTQKMILEALQKPTADVILSDMAPNATGIHSMDHENIIELCSSVFEFAKQVLRINGILLCKLWEGGLSGAFRKDLSQSFKTVKIIKPHASRKDSAELYFLAKGFKKP
ncbi:rRNA methyltransferase 2, mitochondrial-like [Ptychodera flava]|uniref:rRNA methyltransferase 2, mitochondrial-like n=1 Tax=Ptychodera flava TaxID=63121 RepID=UPI00396A3861